MTAKLRRWTVGAVLCLKRGCVCKGCQNLTLETGCVMNETVFALIKKFGAPEGYIEDTALLYDATMWILPD